MSYALAFNALAYAKKLRKAGVPEQQAEVQAEALAELVNDQIMTREYLDLRLREMETNLKHELTLRLGGMLAAGIAIVAALVKLL